MKQIRNFVDFENRVFRILAPWLRRIALRPPQKDAPRKEAPISQILVKIRAPAACFMTIFCFCQGVRGLFSVEVDTDEVD